MNASALKTIDGQDATEWMKKFSFSGFFQDPDALYNGMLFNLPLTRVSGTGGFFTSRGLYTGTKMSVTFENGTTKEFGHTATSTADFSGVKDGNTFYEKFCSGKQQATAASLTDYEHTAFRDHRFLTANPISYPPFPLAQRTVPPVTPLRESMDGAAAGYFLEGKDSKVAVLNLRSFVGAAENNDPLWDFSYTVTKFLEDCRKAGKEKLIVDVSGNRGGTIFLGYDTFKQVSQSVARYPSRYPKANRLKHSFSQQAKLKPPSTSVLLSSSTSLELRLTTSLSTLAIQRPQLQRR